MTTTKRVLLFIVLPMIAVLSFPPNTLVNAAEVILFAAGFFLLIGFLLWRGRSLALTFAIFLQGMNVIIRLMLFFAHAVPKSGVLDVPFAVTMLIGLGLSLYLTLRLDRTDVRTLMTV
jgi:hypothetical protein